MATVRKRGDTYQIRVSCGYDSNGRQIEKSIAWKPAKGMTKKQIEKELERQKVLFEEKCMTGQFLDGNITFAEFAERWFKDYAEKTAQSQDNQGLQRPYAAYQCRNRSYTPCQVTASSSYGVLQQSCRKGHERGHQVQSEKRF